MRKIAVLLLLGLTFSFSAHAADIVSRIDIEGNNRVSDAKIISNIKVRAGEEFNEDIINKDVKSLYSTGFFVTVDVESRHGEDGIAVVFRVKEKPVLKNLDIEGPSWIRKSKVSETAGLKEDSFVDDYTLSMAANRITDFYKSKGFNHALVTYTIEVDEDNKADVKIVVEEKAAVKVREINIKGNHTFTRNRLVKVMKTRTAWLFNRGLFKQDVLNDDRKRLIDFYRLAGYGEVAVAIDVERKAKGIYLQVNIEEGPRSYVGEVYISGNENITTGNIRAAMQLKQGDFFSEQAVYEESSRIREVYMDAGYIFAQINPSPVFNPDTGKVDITYDIVENHVAYVEKIDIRGNVKTKDTVIRRQLRIFPGDRFDGQKIKKSKERLDNLDFFEEVRFGTEPGTEDDRIDLTLDVNESKTGYFSFGGGYSSVDEFIGFVELRQRNFDYQNWSTFTGAGQDVSLTCSFGTLTENLSLSFTNPWIFNRPISFGFDAYKKSHKQEEDVGYAYEDDVRGGLLRLGREFNDYWNGSMSYRLERVTISDVVPEATQDLKNEAGTNNLSSGAVSLSFDTRDSVIIPTRGVYIVNSFQMTGGPFGGDKDFSKYFGEASVYFPFINKSVIELRVRGGVECPFDDTDKVPIYERFFTGGASSVRGYNERKIGPIDSATEDPLGGESVFVGNFEYTYPLADSIKLATFFDAGRVWDKKDNFFETSLMRSIGAGIRVKTPIGPISIDYGWPLDLEPGEDKKKGRFHFNVARGF